MNRKLQLIRSFLRGALAAVLLAAAPAKAQSILIDLTQQTAETSASNDYFGDTYQWGTKAVHHYFNLEFGSGPGAEAIDLDGGHMAASEWYQPGASGYAYSLLRVSYLGDHHWSLEAKKDGAGDWIPLGIVEEFTGALTHSVNYDYYGSESHITYGPPDSRQSTPADFKTCFWLYRDTTNTVSLNLTAGTAGNSLGDNGTMHCTITVVSDSPASLLVRNDTDDSIYSPSTNLFNVYLDWQAIHDDGFVIGPIREPQPIITTQPAPLSLVMGSSGSFHVVATGTGSPVHYQWWRLPAGSSTWEAVAGDSYSGAETDTLVLNAATGTMTGDQFYCVVSNDTEHVQSTIVPLVVLTSLEAWRLDHFGITANTGEAADGADRDHDGRANLHEYAFGSDPKTADAGSATEVGTVTDATGSHLTLRFHRLAYPDISYTVEASDDLVSFSPIWSSAGAANITEWTTVIDTAISTATTSRRFLRLVVRSIGLPPPVQEAPTDLVAAADSPTQITLSWSDNSHDETGFAIERSASSTGGWEPLAMVGANVTTFADTGLAANTLWYYRIRAFNSGGDSLPSAVSSTHTAYYSDKGTPVWRALLLVYPNTDTDWVDADGVTQHETGSLSGAEMRKAEEKFRLFVARAHEFSARECLIQYDIVYIERPITHVSSLGGGAYWLAPSETAPEIKQYAPAGAYDSIMVHWHRGDIASWGWGLAIGPSGEANGATYGTVTEASNGIWDYGHHVWLHEWLHGTSRFFTELGYRQPDRDADGAADHGYAAMDDWGLYYRDLMTGKVWEPIAPAEFTGITTEAWRCGSVTNGRALAQADYFTTDTLTSYKKFGSVVWQPGDENVELGTPVMADNTLYTTLRPTNLPTLTGRLYVPPSGAGVYDSVAVALRNPSAEWWATIEYGTSLTKQFSLMRNNVRLAVSAASITAGSWYTVKVWLDSSTDTIRMKGWKDGENEPANWLCTAPLGGWNPTEVGFRHYGQGTKVDDLFISAPVAATLGFAPIPAGTFSMGDAFGEGMGEELPQHRVTLPSFLMARSLTTWGDWQTVRTWAVTHGYTDLAGVGSGKAPTHPVQTVSWYETMKWCNARSEMEGLTPCYYTDDGQTIVYRTGSVDVTNAQVRWTSNGYRLPTEAEWEYAARGGYSGRRFPWGDTISHSQGNYNSDAFLPYDLSGTRGHHPVYNDGTEPHTSPAGAFAPNRFGLDDMAGNVWQWCWDWYGGYGATAQTSPYGPASGTARVYRGGCWYDFAWYARASFRYGAGPGDRGHGFGFRVARSL